MFWRLDGTGTPCGTENDSPIACPVLWYGSAAHVPLQHHFSAKADDRFAHSRSDSAVRSCTCFLNAPGRVRHMQTTHSA